MELLDHIISVCLTLWKAAKLFSQWLNIWDHHQKYVRVPTVLCPHQSALFILAILIGLWWHLIVTLICNSTMTLICNSTMPNDSDKWLHLFICPFAFQISFLVRCLLRSFVHVLVGFSQLSVESSLCVPDARPLSHGSALSTSPSTRPVFSFSWPCLSQSSVCHSDEAHFCFSLLECTLHVLPSTVHVTTGHSGFSPVFSSTNVTATIHYDLILYKVWGWSWSSLSTWERPIVPVPCVEKIILSPLNCCHAFKKPWLCSCGSTCGPSLVFHGCVRRSLCQYHRILTTIAL